MTLPHLAVSRKPATPCTGYTGSFGRMAGRLVVLRSVATSGCALVLVRGEHDQGRRVAPQKRQPRLRRIMVVSDDCVDINAECRHCRTRIILRE